MSWRSSKPRIAEVQQQLRRLLTEIDVAAHLLDVEFDEPKIAADAAEAKTLLEAAAAKLHGVLKGLHDRHTPRVPRRK